MGTLILIVIMASFLYWLAWWLMVLYLILILAAFWDDLANWIDKNLERLFQWR